MKIVMDFVEEYRMENKIFAYMRITTNHKTQKIDRQKQTIIEYSVNNGFNIDEFVSDIITGGTKADNRPNYHNMKKHFRNGDTLIISDVDRLGRNADDVIVEIKDLQSKGKKLGRPATGVPKEFVKEYNKFQSGQYGSISVVQFAKLQGIAMSIFYKYVGILKEK